MKQLLKYVSMALLSIAIMVIIGLFFPYQIPNVKYFPCGAGYLRLKLNEFEQRINIDVLVLGSSHAYRGIDPRIFRAVGLTLYNLGSSNQTPTQSLLLLKYSLKFHKPSMVVLEVSPELMGVDGTESACDIISASSNFGLAYRTFLTEPNLVCFNTLLVSRCSKFFNGGFIQCEPRTEKDMYIQGGYAERTLCKFNCTSYSKVVYKPNKKSLKAVEEIAFICKLSNIKLVLVQSPVTKRYFDSIVGKETFDEQMKFFGHYINFNMCSIGILDPDDFYDSNHLCKQGAKKFSDALLKELL